MSETGISTLNTVTLKLYSVSFVQPVVYIISLVSLTSLLEWTFQLGTQGIILNLLLVLWGIITALIAWVFLKNPLRCYRHIILVLNFFFLLFFLIFIG